MNLPSNSPLNIDNNKNYAITLKAENHSKLHARDWRKFTPPEMSMGSDGHAWLVPAHGPGRETCSTSTLPTSGVLRFHSPENRDFFFAIIQILFHFIVTFMSHIFQFSL